MVWKYCNWELENISIFVCLKNSHLFIFSKPCPCCNVMQAPLMLTKTAPNILISSLYSILFLLQMIQKGKNYATPWPWQINFRDSNYAKCFRLVSVWEVVIFLNLSAKKAQIFVGTQLDFLYVDYTFATLPITVNFGHFCIPSTTPHSLQYIVMSSLFAWFHLFLYV